MSKLRASWMWGMSRMIPKKCTTETVLHVFDVASKIMVTNCGENENEKSHATM